MFGKLTGLGERAFPERQVLIRSKGKVVQLSITGTVQAVAAAALLAGVSGGLYAGYRAHLSHRAVAQSIATLDAQLADAKAAAETARDQLRQLAVDRGDSDATAQTADAPHTTDPTILAQRVAARIASLEAELKTAQGEQDSLKADREKLAAEKGKLQTRVSQLERDRRKVVKTGASERAVLREKVASLEKKLRRADAHAVSQEAGHPAGHAEEKTSDAGFDMRAFLRKLGIGTKRVAEGGPYVALGSGKAAESRTLDPATLAVLKTLPLSAPLAHFVVDSPFGVRTDPINGRRSIHTGLDLAAPYKSPVYSTSAGTVVFSGWDGAYGKMVEIDHGHGIHTRYAHLNRLMVNRGQHVRKHQEIGLLGSTGRSTGPHVHYEVLVNGVARNPELFFNAGKSLGVVQAKD